MAERRPSFFRQRDISRAIKAARQAGEVGEIRIEVGKDGKLVIISSPEPEKAHREVNEWDAALP